MKKVIISCLVVLLSLIANANNKKENPEKICYINTTSEQYHLSDDQKENLEKLYTNFKKDRATVVKQFKAKEITKEELKKSNKVKYKKYLSDLASLTGASKKEVVSFEKEVRKKCKGAGKK